MKNVYTVILAACLATAGSMTVQAQTYNTAYGTGALASNTSGVWNTAVGYNALNSNTTGSYNTAFGISSLLYNVDGNDDTAIGASALQNNTSGIANTATGYLALLYNTEGFGNTADGNTALSANTTGSYNIAIGSQAGYNIVGSYNIDIGNEGTSSDSGVIRVGTSGNQTSFYAAGISGVTISDGVEVYINSSGQLGTVNSSIRFKKDVRDMADASNRLFQLRPVTYRYKQAYADGSNPVEYGLIAEEVAQVYPDMVARDATGQIQTVQYQKLTPLLLNEVQKEHRQLEAQQQTIEMLAQRLAKLEAATSSTNTTFAMVSK